MARKTGRLFSLTILTAITGRLMTVFYKVSRTLDALKPCKESNKNLCFIRNNQQYS
jgi:hypothetical protein